LTLAAADLSRINSVLQFDAGAVYYE
jgi:hypothetical protein